MKYFKDDKNKPKLSIMQKEALRPKSLRITGLRAPARQLMSEAGRMRLEARKLRRAGDKQGYYDLMRRAAAEKIAGEPTVKSQAFVDAQEEAKKNQPDLVQRTQDMINEFMRMRNRRRPDEDLEDDMWRGPYMNPDIMPREGPYMNPDIQRGQETRY